MNPRFSNDLSGVMCHRDVLSSFLLEHGRHVYEQYDFMTKQTPTYINLLTLYHTIPNFNDPEEIGFGKHCGKRRTCWSPACSPFPTVFSTLS